MNLKCKEEWILEEEKKENIIQTENSNNEEKPKKKSKIRMILVIAFILIFAIVSYIQTRGSYLEYLELGENYLDIFYTNLCLDICVILRLVIYA